MKLSLSLATILAVVSLCCLPDQGRLFLDFGRTQLVLLTLPASKAKASFKICKKKIL